MHLDVNRREVDANGGHSMEGGVWWIAGVIACALRLESMFF